MARAPASARIPFADPPRPDRPLHQPRRLVPGQLHRAGRIPADQRQRPDERAVRPADRAPPDDHRRRPCDRDDRGAIGRGADPGPAQDRARPRPPPGRAPRGCRCRSARPRSPASEPGEARARSAGAGHAGRPRPALRSPRPGRCVHHAARDGAIWAEGPVYLPGRRRGDLERCPRQRRAPMGRRRPAPGTSTGRRTSRTATRSIGTARSSPASTARDGSPGTRRTARGRPSSIATRVTGSTRPTTSSSPRTGRSGSPIRPTASSMTRRATGPTRSSAAASSSGSTATAGS